MKILFFASTECPYCDTLYNNLKESGLLSGHDFIYIDALSDDTQEICDKNKVDELPHIKIYDNSKLILNYCGEILIKDVEEYLKNGWRKNGVERTAN